MKNVTIASANFLFLLNLATATANANIGGVTGEHVERISNDLSPIASTEPTLTISGQDFHYLIGLSRLAVCYVPGVNATHEMISIISASDPS